MLDSCYCIPISNWTAIDERPATRRAGLPPRLLERSTTTGRSFHDMGELKNRIESIYEAIGRIYTLPSPVPFSGFTAQLAVAVTVRCRPSCNGAAARGRVIAVKNEGIHNPQSDKQHRPPQPRCSYRNSLYYTGTVHVRTYVRHRKQESNMQTCKVRLFICALCGGLLAVPHRSITFLFLIHSGDCAWCRQGEHGPLGRVLVTLNLPLGLAATERCIPTRPPILPALYEGDPLPA